jgi:hypothetical protein
MWQVSAPHLTQVGLAYGTVFICALFIGAAWWGLVRNGWTRLVGDIDQRSPANGSLLLASGLAVIAFCGYSALAAFLSVQAQ